MPGRVTRAGGLDPWGAHALAGECPPASACGRHLLLYFAHKGMGPPRVEPTSASAFPSLRKPCPVAAGRLLGKVKEEAGAVRRRPGDICRGAYRPLRGPQRSH